MATSITIALDDSRESELNKRKDDHNKGFPGNPVTVGQIARNILRDALDASAQTRVDVEKLAFRSVYEKASPADKAIMDAIRARYV